ncbi:MAG TPA: methionine--tRNA ligase [Firmicutes bacterium]|nr:methionine--tRNA ligase [Bacillota bacterium]
MQDDKGARAKGEKFYLTTAIDYVNGEPHLGHAYEKIAADVISRFKRLAGYDTFFLTGTDEHSLNVARKAESEGLTPKEFCDRMVSLFKRAWDVLNIRYDRFIRTTDDDHIATVQDMVRRASERGYIYEGTYSGWYCVSCEAFLREDDLVEGHCPLHPSKKVEWVEEKNYFFALSKFQEPLLRHIEEHPEFIQPETRRNEIVNRLKEGLQDVSISRSTMAWGVPMPLDERQVVYVWFDALINYVTGAGYMAGPDQFNKWWPADLHLIGKDITWFHCVIWPAMLMACGFPLPRTVFGHGFVNIKGAKMSKTEGTVIDPVTLAQRFGADALRFYLMREIPFGRDGDFSIEGLIHCYNSDLANDLGNLLNRTMAMTDKFLDGVIPGPGAGRALAPDRAFIEESLAAVRAARAKMEGLDFSGAIEEIWRVVTGGNKYIDERAPWSLAKSEETREELNTVMYNVAEALRIAAITLTPFMPAACEKIWNQLGLTGSPQDAGWDQAERWGVIPPGTRIRRGSPIFPRIEEGEKAVSQEKVSHETEGHAEKATEKPAETPTEKPGPEGEGLITIDEFARVNLRVAKVVDAAKVQGADKLLRLEVDLGGERRQIVAGIALQYSPAELIGKEIVVVANLKPAKLRGLISQGMLLAAVAEDGRLSVLTTDREIGAGAKVR